MTTRWLIRLRSLIFNALRLVSGSIGALHLALQILRDLLRNRAHARVVAADERDEHAAAPPRVRADTDVLLLDALLQRSECRRNARLRQA
jgi:hypothetical protein